MDFNENLNPCLDMEIGDLTELNAAFALESSPQLDTQSVNGNPTEQMSYHTFKVPLPGQPKLVPFAFSK